nr:hypothetical protein [Trametes cingulata]
MTETIRTINNSELNNSIPLNNNESIALGNIQSPPNSQVARISDQSLASPQNPNSQDSFIAQCPFEENISLLNLMSIPNIKLIIIIIFLLTLIYFIYKNYSNKGFKIVFPLLFLNKINIFCLYIVKILKIFFPLR